MDCTKAGTLVAMESRRTLTERLWESLASLLMFDENTMRTV
jgi:hypothetical protein